MGGGGLIQWNQQFKEQQRDDTRDMYVLLNNQVYAGFIELFRLESNRVFKHYSADGPPSSLLR